MSFLYYNYVWIIITFFLFSLLLSYKQDQQFFQTIEKYFFKKRSLSFRISRFLKWIFFILLCLSLLDLRGPEEKIKQKISAQKTIILIDTSASMLAEDVRPSRLQKAILIAKHFARKSAGQEISIAVFAEIQKKIVPFTSDLDLIDSRLESLKNLRNQYGGSALTTAIAESIQYFKESGEEISGNIVVITDGEETVDGVDLEIPDKMKIAFIGVGSNQGGKIPLDDGRGFRFGYKISKGVEVVTKLNEDFFKNTVKNNPKMKYWLANTYSLPSDEILNFFRGDSSTKQSDQEMRIRPVYVEYILVPAIIIFILSVMFKFVTPLVSLILVFSVTSNANEKKIDPELPSLVKKIQNGSMDNSVKLRLAQKFSQSGEFDQAQKIYEEINPKMIPSSAQVNQVTNFLEKKDVDSAIKKLKSINQKELTQSEKEVLYKNTLAFFNQKNQQEKNNKQDKKKNKDQKDQGEQKNQSGQGGEGEKKDSSSNQQDQKKQDKNQENKENNKDQKKDEEKKNDDINKNDNQSTPDKPKNMPRKVLPAKLKQLMSDD